MAEKLVFATQFKDLKLRDKYIRLKIMNILFKHYPNALGADVNPDEYVSTFKCDSTFICDKRRYSDILSVDVSNILLHYLKYGDVSIINAIKLSIGGDNHMSIVAYVIDVIDGTICKHVTCQSRFIKFLKDIEFIILDYDLNIVNCLCGILLERGCVMSLNYLSRLIDEMDTTVFDIQMKLIEHIQLKMDIELLKVNFEDIINTLYEASSLLTHTQIDDVIIQSIENERTSIRDHSCIDKGEHALKLKKYSFEFATINKFLTKYDKVVDILFKLKDKINNYRPKRCVHGYIEDDNLSVSQLGDEKKIRDVEL